MPNISFQADSVPSPLKLGVESVIRQVAYYLDRTEQGRTTFTERMKRKIDSAAGRALYAICLAIGEPPFANIRSAFRLDRFTIRGKRKVNVQWNLFCIVHNMKKIQRYGPGFAHQRKWQDAGQIIRNVR